MKKFLLIYGKDVAFRRRCATIKECYTLYTRFSRLGYDCSIYELNDYGCKMLLVPEFGINHLSQYMEGT